jgi:hypothetical protein
MMFSFFESTAKAESCNSSTEAHGAPAESAEAGRPGGETPPLRPEKEAHAARLKKFKREQLVVDYLNRGVSIVEIAARIGVGEKRMRAIIREIIARRQPHPPEEFVVIQISRLNEAMLNAFSAMSPKNLKAVAQVVRIVGQLDRYHGFDAADWRRRLERARQNKPADETATYGGALFCSAELALQDDEMERLDLLLEGGFGGLPGAGARPENPRQELENIDSMPEDLAALVEMLRGAAAKSPLGDAPTQSAVGRPAAFGSPPPGLRSGTRDDGAEGVVEAPATGARPENPPQDAEKVGSAPENPTSAAPLACHPRESGGPEAAAGTLPTERPNLNVRFHGHDIFCERQGGARPENPAQRVDNIDSAPENTATASPPACPLRESGGPEAAAETLPTERLNLGAGFHGHDIFRERQGDERPENPPQATEKIESAPGMAPDPYASPVYFGPDGERLLRVRMMPNGVMAG